MVSSSNRFNTMTSTVANTDLSNTDSSTTIVVVGFSDFIAIRSAMERVVMTARSAFRPFISAIQETASKLQDLYGLMDLDPLRGSVGGTNFTRQFPRDWIPWRMRFRRLWSPLFYQIKLKASQMRSSANTVRFLRYLPSNKILHTRRKRNRYRV